MVMKLYLKKKLQNKKRMKQSLLAKNGYIHFVIEIEEDTEYRMEFKVYEVNSWDAEEPGNTPVDDELYVQGYIKWDGCSDVYFGIEENGHSLHLCGKTDWILHAEVMMAIYNLAADTIKNYNKEVAE